MHIPVPPLVPGESARDRFQRIDDYTEQLGFNDTNLQQYAIDHHFSGSPVQFANEVQYAVYSIDSRRSRYQGFGASVPGSILNQFEELAGERGWLAIKLDPFTGRNIFGYSEDIEPSDEHFTWDDLALLTFPITED